MDFYRGIRHVTQAGFFAVAVFAIVTFRNMIPDEIYVTAGEENNYDFGVPVSIVMKDEGAEVLANFSEKISDREPSYMITCKLFGVIPVGDVKVNLVEDRQVCASGETIGIYVKTKGILVIDTATVTDAAGERVSPAKHLVRGGDYIVSVNGETVSDKEELTEKIAASGSAKDILGLYRNGEFIEVSMTPVRDETGNYLLGIWVRDDLAGVGTLTYYDETYFGALGHAVSDGDTGTQMELSEGWIYPAKIVGIRKGENGTPGELSGVIDYQGNKPLGEIADNTALGIYGTLNEGQAGSIDAELYEIGYKQRVHPGTAYIISEVTGEREIYEINIQSLDLSRYAENKGILFEVTDQRLLDATGGIVQGMSGSPIIQDEKLIGAVTHVFVSDSSRGYGIFIEKMLNW